MASNDGKTESPSSIKIDTGMSSNPGEESLFNEANAAEISSRVMTGVWSETELESGGMVVEFSTELLMARFAGELGFSIGKKWLAQRADKVPGSDITLPECVMDESGRLLSFLVILLRSSKGSLFTVVEQTVFHAGTLLLRIAA